MRLFNCLVLLFAALTGACASRSPAPIVSLQAQQCGETWALESAIPIWLDAQAPVRERFDGSSRCISTDDGSAIFASYKLPAFRQPYSIDIDSEIAGQTLFAPEVLLLDAAGKVTRRLEFDRFSARGERVEGTVFMHPENRAERYLIVRSAAFAVGRTGDRYISGSVVVPLVNTVLPMLVMYGTEYSQRYTYSHSGVVYVDARSSKAPRREKLAMDAARAQF
ncbi:MAG: MalM family protein [Panacagrimonas sp.]